MVNSSKIFIKHLYSGPLLGTGDKGMDKTNPALVPTLTELSFILDTNLKGRVTKRYVSYDLGEIFNYTNNSFTTVISIIKLSGLVWNIQKVIPEGAIFKLGPKGYIYVYVSQRIGGNSGLCRQSSK